MTRKGIQMGPDPEEPDEIRGHGFEGRARAVFVVPLLLFVVGLALTWTSAPVLAGIQDGPDVIATATVGVHAVTSPAMLLELACYAIPDVGTCHRAAFMTSYVSTSRPAAPALEKRRQSPRDAPKGQIFGVVVDDGVPF